MGGLNTSAEAFVRTPPTYQRDVISQPSSEKGRLVTVPTIALRLSIDRSCERAKERLPRISSRIGRLFSGLASTLDAFRSYQGRRGCPAVPCRTTGKLEAAAPSSSRTVDTFPSSDQHSQQIKSDLYHVTIVKLLLSRDGLNPAHVPLVRECENKTSLAHSSAHRTPV